VKITALRGPKNPGNPKTNAERGHDHHGHRPLQRPRRDRAARQNAKGGARRTSVTLPGRVAEPTRRRRPHATATRSATDAPHARGAVSTLPANERTVVPSPTAPAAPAAALFDVTSSTPAPDPAGTLVRVALDDLELAANARRELADTASTVWP
jgi:hypothetical protein